MFIIVTKGTERRRLEIPHDVITARAVDAYCAKPPADAWANAEPVGPSWPSPEPAVSVESIDSDPPASDSEG